MALDLYVIVRLYTAVTESPLTTFNWQAQPIYLASASPRRFELLSQIGVDFTRITVDVDESQQPGEDPESYVKRLAAAKALAGWQASDRKQSWPVIGADTCVVIDDKILGKPKDQDEGVAMLRLLSARQHRVLSAVTIKFAEHEYDALSTSEVWFRPLSDADIEAYWQTLEPVDKAGAYGVQGFAGAFIEKIVGSYSGIMGLPLLETANLIVLIQKYSR